MSAPRGLRRPVSGEVPITGTPEYAWWSEGCQAEATARKKGRSEDGLQVRDLVDGLAENWPGMGAAEIAAFVYNVRALPEMPLRQRLGAALRILRGWL